VVGASLTCSITSSLLRSCAFVSSSSTRTSSRSRAAKLVWVVGTGLLCDVSTRCAVIPPPGLYGVVGTGVLRDVSTLCAVVPPPGLYGVVGTGVLCDVSTRCAVIPPPGLYGVVGTGVLCDVSTWSDASKRAARSFSGRSLTTSSSVRRQRSVVRCSASSAARSATDTSDRWLRSETSDLPRPVLIPKQLGLGFNKTGQQLCFQWLTIPLITMILELTIRVCLYSEPVS
jgi:hypothetical protein